MKLEGRISILINRDYTTIEIEDENANVTFAKIRLTPEQLSVALSRQACVECKLEIVGMEKLGKKHENKTFEFELPEAINIYDRDSKKLQEIAQSKINNGWIADSYFRCQNSFFKKNGKNWARCTIRRWI